MDGTPTTEKDAQNARSDARQGNGHARTQTPQEAPILPVMGETWEEDEIPGVPCMLTEDQTAKDKAQMIIECFGDEEARALIIALWAEVKGGIRGDES